MKLSQDNLDQVRDFVATALRKNGDESSFNDSDKLFSSGRLDSLTMMKLVLLLETDFNFDFSQFDFDVDLIDSIEAIARLVADS
jgi:acyl carrier protein